MAAMVGEESKLELSLGLPGGGGGGGGGGMPGPCGKQELARDGLKLLEENQWS